MTTSIRTTERIPITKTPPKTELGNDHQLEQLFGEALGDIPTADETRKAWQTFIRRHRIRHHLSDG